MITPKVCGACGGPPVKPVTCTACGKTYCSTPCFPLHGIEPRPKHLEVSA